MSDIRATKAPDWEPYLSFEHIQMLYRVAETGGFDYTQWGEGDYEYLYDLENKDLIESFVVGGTSSHDFVITQKGRKELTR